MKRKIWANLLACVMALCLTFGLAACGEKGGPAEPNGGSSPTLDGGSGGNQEEPDGGSSDDDQKKPDGSSDDDQKEPDGGSDDNEDDNGSNDEEPHVHFAERFFVDDEQHWKICAECKEKFDIGDHNNSPEHDCETCGYGTVYTEGLQYELDSATDTYTVVGKGTMAYQKELVIPAYYEGKPVAAIGSDAFHMNTQLVSVTIGHCVTSIGMNAFRLATHLVNINIPDSATIIDGAFTDTGYYNDPDNWDSSGVLYIGNHLYEAKPDVIPSEYTIRQGTKTIAGDAFAFCENLTKINLPNGLAVIGEEAFWHCKALQDVEIPSSVVSFENKAFAYCTGLQRFVVGSGVKSLGGYAFWGCSNLTSITIPASVKSIGMALFHSDRAITDVWFEGTVQEWQAIEKDVHWSYNCSEFVIKCKNGSVTKSGTVTMN